MIEGFVKWCDQVNPQSESENMVIRYGAELLFENCLKLLILVAIGFVIGKGYETAVFGVNGGTEENQQPTGNSFSYTPTQTHKGFILHLDTYIDIDGSINLDLRVVSSFLS